MANSINTNVGALVALKNLNATNTQLDKVQNRVSTGLKVSSAVDDGAAFAVAQGLRGDVQAFDTVNQQLSVAKGAVGVALEAATSISNTLNDLKSTITKLADAGLSASARTQYEADFAAQTRELQNFYTNATYNGQNLINTAATNTDVISNVSGGTYTVTARDLQTTIDALAGITPDQATAAGLLAGTGTEFTAAVDATNTALNGLAADSRRIDNQITFNNAVRDATETGLGSIVDADLARESARLQALQTKQQLSVQALGIANQAPSALLGLFR